jgi:opacity protein-like surface antigen
MGWLRTLYAVGLLAAQATAAAAADMPGTTMPPPAPQWHPRQLIDLSNGWYLRGDLGYAWGTLDGADTAPSSISPYDSTLGNGMTGGIGVGIKNKWLRADLTFDYLAPLDYTGAILGPNDVVAKISAISALFNGYLDLGTWYRATPYIGAGAGAAYMSATDFASSTAPFASTSHDQWNFAWAAMAGFAYPMTHNLMLDVGYRYINFGDVKIDADVMTFKNVAAEEVRAGLRWSFED